MTVEMLKCSRIDTELTTKINVIRNSHKMKPMRDSSHKLLSFLNITICRLDSGTALEWRNVT